MGKENKKTYMLGEVPKKLEECGVAAELARSLVEKFAYVRMTEKTCAAIKRAVSYAGGDGATHEDANILYSILSDVIGEDKARAETDRLLDSFGSILGVLDAIDRFDRGVALTPGVRIRVELLSAIYIESARKVKILTREQVERLCTDKCEPDKTYALVLDGDLAGKDAILLGSDVLPKNAKNLIAKDGAKYAVLLRKIAFIPNEYFDLASRVEAFAAELSKCGVMLLDFLIFDSQGMAALEPRMAGKKAKFEYTPIALPMLF